jgi:hypothetical protein
VTVAVRTLADQVWALQQAITNVNHYRGNVASNPPLDPDGKVHAYAVLYAGAGRAFGGRMVAAPGQTDWTFQVTCVGGDDNRALWCVDKIRAALTGAPLAVSGTSAGRIRELTNPGPVRRDDDVSPPRYYLPLLFGVHVAG